MGFQLLCSSDLVYWSTYIYIYLLFYICYMLLRLNCCYCCFFAHNWSYWEFTAHIHIHENHTHLQTERKSRWWSSYGFAWETSYCTRQLPLIQCPSQRYLLLVMMMLLLLLFVCATLWCCVVIAVFHFKSDVNQARSAHIFPDFEAHSNQFAHKRLFCCYFLNWGRRARTHTQHWNFKYVEI